MSKVGKKRTSETKVLSEKELEDEIKGIFKELNADPNKKRVQYLMAAIKIAYYDETALDSIMQIYAKVAEIFSVTTTTTTAGINCIVQNMYYRTNKRTFIKYMGIQWNEEKLNAYWPKPKEFIHQIVRWIKEH